MDQLSVSPGGDVCTCGKCIQNMTNSIHRLTARKVNANDDWEWNWFKGLRQKEYIGLIAISALAMNLFLLCM